MHVDLCRVIQGDPSRPARFLRELHIIIFSSWGDPSFKSLTHICFILNVCIFSTYVCGRTFTNHSKVLSTFLFKWFQTRVNAFGLLWLSFYCTFLTPYLLFFLRPCRNSKSPLYWAYLGNPPRSCISFTTSFLACFGYHAIPIRNPVAAWSLPVRPEN